MQDVTIIGGGLAGLAAATRLAPNTRVTILEARPRLGGRASSFTDPVSGQLIDTCQHVSMGCCTAFREFATTIGVEQFLQPQETLYFVTPDGRTSRFRRDPWPAPFHVGRALASAHYLSAGEKLRIGWGLMQLARESPDYDPPLLDWLIRARQTPRCIDRFWRIVLTSALNASVEELGFRYARKVFVDAFLTDRDGFVVEIPSVPLGQFYGEALRSWLSRHHVAVREDCAVKQVNPGQGFTVELRNGDVLEASRVILAVPFDRVLSLLPESIAQQPFFQRIANLEASPITSVHLWYDRDVFPYPHAVLLDSLGQWVFRRPGGYLQVVVSASADLKARGRDDIERIIVAELRSIFPQLAEVKLLRAKVVTEHAATFASKPGVDANRPAQATPVPGLFLAGDWTATGWPATMEGAVRSGYLAAQALVNP